MMISNPMGRVRCFVFLLLIAPLFLVAQNKRADSLANRLQQLGQDTDRVNTLGYLAEAVRLKDPARAMTLVDEAIPLARSLNHARGLVFAYQVKAATLQLSGKPTEAIAVYKEGIEAGRGTSAKRGFAALHIRLGYLYFTNGQLSEALPYLREGAALAENVPAYDLAGEAYRGMGMTYTGIGEHTLATENFLEAIEMAEKGKKMSEVGYTYITMGNSQQAQKDYDNALKSYRKALEILRAEKNVYGMAGSYISIGNIYYHQENYDSALVNYRESLELNKQMNDKKGIAGLKENIGNILLRQGYPEEALVFYNEGLELFRQISDSSGISASLNNVGRAYFELKQYDKAELYMIRGLDIARRHNFTEWKKDSYEELAKLYFTSGRYREAYLYKDSLEQIKALMIGQEHAEKSKELEAKFNTRRNEEKIQHLNAINAEKDVVAAKQRQIIIAVSAGLGLVVILLFFLVRTSAARRRANLRLEEQNKVIAEKNKDITDSITYARRIQQSVMPDERILQKTVADYFIFNRPRDIVSGDFFWLAEKGSRTYIAVADCTGHGVPGALVSVIGINMLNKVVEQPGNPSPSGMLELLHALVISALNKDKDARETNDGMDIALLCIDREKNKALFSGAGRPMYYADNAGLHLIKGDRYSVAGEKKENDAPFSEQEIPLTPGMTFYLSSDGFVDQFGENTGKKYLSKRFQELLSSIATLPMDAQAGRIEKEFVSWKGKLEQVDDVLVLGVRV